MSVQTELKLARATEVLESIVWGLIVVGVPAYGIASLYAIPVL